MTENRVKVIDTVGTPWALSPADGEVIYELLEPFVASNRPVVLDFEGIQNTTTTFLNYAIGTLYGYHSIDDIERLLSFENARENTLALIKVAISNSLKYFADPVASEERDRRLIEDY